MCSRSWVHWNQKIAENNEKKTRNRFFKRFLFFLVFLTLSVLSTSEFECDLFVCYGSVALMLLKEVDTVSRLIFYYLDLLLFTVFVCLFHSFDNFFSLSSSIITVTTNFSNSMCVCVFINVFMFSSYFVLWPKFKHKILTLSIPLI